MAEKSQAVACEEAQNGVLRPRLRPRLSANVGVAVVLWLASNIFVTCVARIGTWEGVASYGHMADLCKWDCSWYGTVLQSGYENIPMRDSAAANWPFHPLFPITAYPLYKWLKLSLPASMVLAGRLELLLAIYAFMLMLCDEAQSTAELFRAGSLVAFNPYLVYAHAGYAEPLYFAVISLGFYFAERRRWIAAGAMGGLASATRFVGLLFSTSYGVLWLKDAARGRQPRKLDMNRVIGLLLCPLGTAAFLLYMYHHTGDALVQQHAQVAWSKVPGNPLHTLRLCLVQRHWPRVWALMAILGLLVSGWLVKLRKAEMGIFLAIAILIPLSATGWSMPRYIWWQPPFLYAIYRLLGRNSSAWLVYTAFAAGTASFMVLEWFSGHNFLI